MAKKFFYNKVYNTKRTIINVVIIGACIIGIIVCLLLTRNFQGEDQAGSLNIKKETMVEVNEKYGKEIFFSKIENVKLDNIKIKYPDNYDISKVGSYNVKVNINNKDYDVTLNVIDTKKPELAVKNVSIKEGSTYTANDFVNSCSDNSKVDCIIEFYQDGVDEDGNDVDYSKFSSAGEYGVKISAKDESGNQMVEEAKLTISKDGSSSSTPSNPDPSSCKYGNNEYDKENYLIAVDITTNGCAVSLDLYKDSVTANEINKLMETETTKIKKDVEALNLTGTLALNRKVVAIVNTSGDGIVGYELKISVNITNNGKTEPIVEYKVDNKGNRVYIDNPYNLAN